MRPLLVFAAILLLATSCRVHYKPRLSAVKPTGAPYTILKNGERIETDPADLRKANSADNDDKKETPNPGFKKVTYNDVIEYQDTKGRFAQTPDGQMGVQIATGRIALYRTKQFEEVQYTSTIPGGAAMKTGVRKIVTDYLRPGDTGQLFLMNYENLRQVIANPSGSVRSELNEYVRMRNSSRKLNIIGYCTMGVGLGLMVTGAYANSDALFYGGFGLAACGPAVLCVNLARHRKNAKRLYSILNMYNRSR